ncbi:ABC transporter permease [Arthrobacter sp. Soil762]|uniref:ABC transporter permease n=1 Tax=Arthrobacter sp. Soil762 TaxID=1736401 RepID=UPI0006F48E8A|nr:ABC transporter permease [Arthrobacter sp. Soil762]KRE74311.1 hypothetical protein ASG77_06175 [Arthrobacter sp. Soil762]
MFGDEPVFGAGPDGQGGITPAHYYLPGMLALSTILSGFQNLGTHVATERFNGTVKRLAGTPLPAASYFIGKTGQTLYLIVAQTVLLLLAAAVLFDVPLPRDAGQWGLVALLMVLATAAWATVAIAFTALPKSAQSASTLAVLPVLLAALKRLPDTLHLDSLRLTVELPDSLPPLPSTQQVALLRTAQEALNNVRRHSGATAAKVLMDIPAGGPPLLRLTVTDNGQGFEVSADRQGFGLKSMAARLDEIGGRLQLTSAPGATRLVAVVPTEALGPGGTDAEPGTRGTDAPLAGAVT